MQRGTKNVSVGFTLAEVLITLGIIGVVAALTLPSLIQKQVEKQTVSRVQKAYSALQQAYLLAVQSDGTPDEWGATGMYEETSHIFLANKFKPYLKITRDCVGMSISNVAKNCTKKYAAPEQYASVRMLDGTTIIFRFVFYLTKTGIFPIGTESDSLSIEKYCTNTRTFGYPYEGHVNGAACTAWIVFNENMEYLRCSDLSWDGKKKCSK